MERYDRDSSNLVLVMYLRKGDVPHYYTGRYVNRAVEDTLDYTKAVKMLFEDEAEKLCVLINADSGYTWKVEEHAYYPESKPIK